MSPTPSLFKYLKKARLHSESSAGNALEGVSAASATVIARLTWRGLVAVGVLLAAVVFLPCLDNGFVSDDWAFLDSSAQVSDLRGLGGLLAGRPDWFFRPAQWLLTVVLVRLFGVAPLPYHLVSLVLHLGAAYLLFRLLSALLTGAGAHDESGHLEASTLAMLAILLFFFNPRQHETVFWFSSVSEQLATVARLGALLAVWEGLRRGKPLFYAVIGPLLYGTALLCKESAASFPFEVGVLVLLAVFSSRRELRQRLVAGAAVLLPVAVIASAWVAHFLHQSEARTVAPAGLTLLKATPADLLFRYVHCLARTQTVTSLAGSWHKVWLGLGVLSCLTLLALARRRGVWLFALAWTLAALTPFVFTTSEWDVSHGLRIDLRETGIFDDRYYYYPIAAASLLIAASLQWLVVELSRVVSTVRSQVATPLLCILVVVAFVLPNAVRLKLQEKEWDRAGVIADCIIQGAVAALPDPPTGSTICFSGLPDNYKGRYVFRNGIAQALHIAYGRGDFAVVDPERLPGAHCHVSLQFDGSIVSRASSEGSDACTDASRTAIPIEGGQ